jgi:hypothetical protein
MSEPTEGVDALPPAPPPISDEDDIYRRILPEWIVKDPKAPGGKRLSSAAYQPYRDSPCSGYVAKECQHSDVLGIYSDGVSIGAVSAGVIRSQQYTITRDVVPGEHPSHVHLIEPTGLTKGQRRDRRSELADKTRWIAGPSWSN